MTDGSGKNSIQNQNRLLISETSVRDGLQDTVFRHTPIAGLAALAFAIKVSRGGSSMNWDQATGKWSQIKGSVKEKWGKLTDDDLQVIAGKRERLVGKIQERYGIAKEAAEEQVAGWNLPDANAAEIPNRKAS
jgi:uncharacterized protein YjbJ (UPF0337 family)